MRPSKKKKYITIALFALLLIALSLLFSNLPKLSNILGKFMTIIASVVYGFVFAYLMNPVMVRVERGVMKLFGKRNMPERRLKRLARGVGIVVSLIVFLAVVAALGYLLFSQLPRSVGKLVENLGSYRDKIDGWLTKIVAGTSLESTYADWAETTFTKLENWLQRLPQNTSLLTGVLQWTYGAVVGVINALLGIIVAIYMLAYKDTFIAQSKKLVVATCNPERADHLMSLARRSNKAVNGFLVGRVLDSTIIGILCYIGLLILKMPYPGLIAVIVGVTNIIPFFGPLLGLVPSALIVLVETTPLKAFYFIIFILALQQVDGNLIGPWIMGETTGISDFWVLVSTTFFGGLFGVVGMIIGVPLFAVIYMIITDAVNRALERKERPVETTLYYGINSVDDLPAEAPPEQDGYEPTYDTEFDPDDDFEFEDY